MATCPKCGSNLFHWDGKTRSIDSGSSYSFKKGLAGAVLLGPVGAVAGIGGKKNKTNIYLYTCIHCGYSEERFTLD